MKEYKIKGLWKLIGCEVGRYCITNVITNAQALILENQGITDRMHPNELTLYIKLDEKHIPSSGYTKMVCEFVVVNQIYTYQLKRYELESKEGFIEFLRCRPQFK